MSAIRTYRKRTFGAVCLFGEKEPKNRLWYEQAKTILYDGLADGIRVGMG